MYGGARYASTSVDRLCLRRLKYQRPPRIAVAIARRPSVKPTASGTMFDLLSEGVDNAVKLAVGSGVDAVLSRRTLYDQRRARESKGVSDFTFIYLLH